MNEKQQPTRTMVLEAAKAAGVIIAILIGIVFVLPGVLRLMELSTDWWWSR